MKKSACMGDRLKKFGYPVIPFSRDHIEKEKKVRRLNINLNSCRRLAFIMKQKSNLIGVFQTDYNLTGMCLLIMKVYE
jgi:hypothetical protein